MREATSVLSFSIRVPIYTVLGFGMLVHYVVKGVHGNTLAIPITPPSTTKVLLKRMLDDKHKTVSSYSKVSCC